MFGFFGKKKKTKKEEEQKLKNEQAKQELEVDEFIEGEGDELVEMWEPEIDEYVDEGISSADIVVNNLSVDAQQDDIELEEVTQKPKKKGFFAKLSDGLKKTRDNIGQMFDSVFSASDIDDDFYDELEEALIVADVGMKTTTEIVGRLKAVISEKKIKAMDEARAELKSICVEMMQPETDFIADGEKSIILIVGVNGVGKTTSIGKLAHKYKSEGKTVLLAAADTFRAAATEQLVEWSERAGVPIIKYGEGADPAAVVYDSIQSGKSKGTDVIIVDTAGRLHNKKHLMLELSKIRKIIDREYPEARVETLLVLDATTGQNGLEQAKVFAEAVDVSGIILSKLDGTAKGGIVLAIKHDSKIPVRFVGVGEKIDDLQDFDPVSFVDALF